MLTIYGLIPTLTLNWKQQLSKDICLFIDVSQESRLLHST